MSSVLFYSFKVLVPSIYLLIITTLFPHLRAEFEVMTLDGTPCPYLSGSFLLLVDLRTTVTLL